MISNPGFYLILSENHDRAISFCNEFINTQQFSRILWLKETKQKDIEEMIYQIQLSYNKKDPLIVVAENAYTITNKYANSLLKTLEELPDNIYVFFLGSHIHTFLDTIVSRAIQVQLNEDQTLQDPILYACVHPQNISPCQFDEYIQNESNDPSIIQHKIIKLHKALLKTNPEKYILLKPFLEKISKNNLLPGTTISLWRCVFAVCKDTL